MKPLSEITKNELDNIKVLTFDVDGVIVPTGTKIIENSDGTELSMKTHQLSKVFLENVKKLKKHLRINFSSGRSMAYLRSLTNQIFDSDLILQAENGNVTWLDAKMTHTIYDSHYFEMLRDIRNEIGLLMKEQKGIRGFEPKLFFLTIHCDENDEIKQIVSKIDTKGELYCDWTLEGYDIGKRGVNKGEAIKTLAKSLGIKEKEIMTTGNNTNDREMLQVGLGVTVRPDRVEGAYFISPKEGELGGEILADFLVNHFESKE